MFGYFGASRLSLLENLLRSWAQSTDVDCTELFLIQSTDIVEFKRISIPLVRRIYPQLIANDLVHVQPLAGPAALIYYLNFRYSENSQTTNDEEEEQVFRN